MKKIITILFIFSLIILTTVTKNSTKKIDNKIFSIKENISVLENEYSLVLLEYNFLTTPGKLMEYQYKYFEDKLNFLEIDKIKQIEVKNNELIKNIFKK